MYYLFNQLFHVSEYFAGTDVCVLCIVSWDLEKASGPLEKLELRMVVSRRVVLKVTFQSPGKAAALNHCATSPCQHLSCVVAEIPLKFRQAAPQLLPILFCTIVESTRRNTTRREHMSCCKSQQGWVLTLVCMCRWHHIMIHQGVQRYICPLTRHFRVYCA